MGLEVLGIQIKINHFTNALGGRVGRDWVGNADVMLEYVHKKMVIPKGSKNKTWSSVSNST